MLPTSSDRCTLNPGCSGVAGEVLCIGCRGSSQGLRRPPASQATSLPRPGGQLCQCCFRSRQGRTRVDFVQLCLVLQWGSPDFQLRQLFPFLRRLASLRGTLERFIGRAWPQRNPLDALKTPASLGKQRYQPCEISIITARC